MKLTEAQKFFMIEAQNRVTHTMKGENVPFYVSSCVYSANMIEHHNTVAVEGTPGTAKALVKKGLVVHCGHDKYALTDAGLAFEVEL